MKFSPHTNPMELSDAAIPRMAWMVLAKMITSRPSLRSPFSRPDEQMGIPSTVLPASPGVSSTMYSSGSGVTACIWRSATPAPYATSLLSGKPRFARMSWIIALRIDRREKIPRSGFQSSPRAALVSFSRRDQIAVQVRRRTPVRRENKASRPLRGEGPFVVKDSILALVAAAQNEVALAAPPGPAG